MRAGQEVGPLRLCTCQPHPGPSDPPCRWPLPTRHHALCRCACPCSPCGPARRKQPYTCPSGPGPQAVPARAAAVPRAGRARRGGGRGARAAPTAAPGPPRGRPAARHGAAVLQARTAPEVHQVGWGRRGERRVRAWGGRAGSVWCCDAVRTSRALQRPRHLTRIARPRLSHFSLPSNQLNTLAPWRQASRCSAFAAAWCHRHSPPDTGSGKIISLAPHGFTWRNRMHPFPPAWSGPAAVGSARWPRRPPPTRPAPPRWPPRCSLALPPPTTRSCTCCCAPPTAFTARRAATRGRARGTRRTTFRCCGRRRSRWGRAVGTGGGGAAEETDGMSE